MEKDIVLRDVEFWVGFADYRPEEPVKFKIVNVDFDYMDVNFEVEMTLHNYDVSEDVDPTGEDYITVDGKLRFKKSLTINDVFREVHRGESIVEFFIDSEVDYLEFALDIIGKRSKVTEEDEIAVIRCLERELISNEEYVLSVHFHS